MSQNALPVVDLNKYLSGDQDLKIEFIKDLGDALHNVGFVAIRNHGIPQDLVDQYYAAAKKFFSLPERIKKEYEVRGMAGQRGYTSFGKEHAKHSNVGDLKEFFQLGQEIEDGESIGEEYMPNVDVAEVPEFTDLGKRLYREFEKSGRHLLRAIAEHLELPVDYFDSHIHNGNSILRAIHYPPIMDEPESAIRSEEHEDINLITLLVGASAGGLQIFTKNEEWVDIIPGENEIAVNVGDMLQRLTNNYLKSTTHRVVNPPREEWHRPRMSIPFFLHPKSEMRLDCLEFCVTEDRPLAYEPISAGEYLDERLREIGLKK